MDTNRTMGAVAGGLLAGIGMTALLMLMEKKSGQPSELVELERKSLTKVGIGPRRERGLPDGTEQAIAQAGHLILSALAGAAYAATTDEDAGVLTSGLAFGAAFYVALQWIVGPALGVKPPEWRSDDKTLAMHTANHLMFGLVTAAGAKLASRSDDSGR